MLGLRTMLHIVCVEVPGKCKPIVIFYWCEDKILLISMMAIYRSNTSKLQVG